MSNRQVISAEAFKNKATRVIDIPGFEEGELIGVRIKPVSLMGMMFSGKLGNELLPIVKELFSDNEESTKDKNSYMKAFKDTETVSTIIGMMDKVCAEVLIEPQYEEIREFLTDAQKQAIFTASMGPVNEVKPIVQE